MRTCPHADLTKKDATGDTPMTWALRNNKRKLMEQLAEVMETRLRFTRDKAYMTRIMAELDLCYSTDWMRRKLELMYG